MVTTTTYCSVGDISDFLRVPITSTTTPNKEMVRKIIARKEEELDRRIGHTWKTKKITKETHNLPLLYTFGWGTPIFLKHRHILDFDSAAGDKIEIFKGESDSWENILGNTQWYNIEPVYGTLFVRGFLFHSVWMRFQVEEVYPLVKVNDSGRKTLIYVCPIDEKYSL